MATQINLSFQGGGVYLAKMIAMADAFSYANEKGYIKISGVSGTSAGSICAALLASNCDFGALRDRLKLELEQQAKTLAAPYYDGLRWGQVPSALIKILQGKDLISRGKLGNFIEFLMKDAPRKFETISQYHETEGPSLFVARSKLTAPYIDISSEGPLLPTLVDSCSIPFAFKGYKAARTPGYVDGGLCENLPVICFDPEKGIPLFSVSISDTSLINLSEMGALGYLSHLFSMTVGYSVQRSQETVGASNAYNEPADFQFHEIKKAVEWFLDEEKYDNLWDQTLGRIVSYADLHSMAEAGKRFLAGRSTIHKRNVDLKALTNKLDINGAWDILDSHMTVTAHSANNHYTRERRAQNLINRRADHISFISRVKAEISGPIAYKGHINLSDGEIQPSSWRVFNTSTGKDVAFTAIHFQDPDAPNRKNVKHDPCWLLFDNPDVEISKGDILEVSLHMTSRMSENMSGLLDGMDFVQCSNKHDDASAMAIVLRYPKSIGPLFVRKRNELCIPFKEMTPEELAPHIWNGNTEFSLIGVKSCDHDGTIYRAKKDELLCVEFVKAARPD